MLPTLFLAVLGVPSKFYKSLILNILYVCHGRDQHFTWT